MRRKVVDHRHVPIPTDNLMLLTFVRTDGSALYETHHRKWKLARERLTWNEWVAAPTATSQPDETTLQTWKGLYKVQTPITKKIFGIKNQALCFQRKKEKCLKTLESPKNLVKRNKERPSHYPISTSNLLTMLVNVCFEIFFWFGKVHVLFLNCYLRGVSKMGLRVGFVSIQLTP